MAKAIKKREEEKKEDDFLKQENKKIRMLTSEKDNAKSRESLFNYKKHPYGILPNGSAITTNTSITKLRYQKLGKYFYLLKDDVLLYILSYCDIDALCHLIKCNNSYLYILCHMDDLWRDLALAHYLNSSIINWTSNSNNNYKCWKDFLLQKVHTPLQYNYYSDYLFQSWYVMNYNIDSILPKNNTIDVLHYTNAKDIFRTVYQSRNVPCIISSIPNLPKISIEYLYNNIKGNKDTTTFRATSGTASHPANFTLEAYTQYCNKVMELNEDVPLYLFDRNIRTKLPNVCKDVLYNSLYKACPFWDCEATPSHDLFRLLNKEEKNSRPDYQWIIVGPKKSGSIFHIDPNSTNAWNITLKGSKLWILYPPHIIPPGIHPSKDLDTVVLPMSISEWIYQYWNDHLEHRRKGECYEGITNEGDVIFVPHNWWHCVINLGESNIALTMNYVCEENLKHVLWFTKYRMEQVSGVRDRKEAVQPDELHDEFSKCLKGSGLYDEDFLHVGEDFKCDCCGMMLKANSDAENVTSARGVMKRKKRDGDDKTTKKSCNMIFQGYSSSNNSTATESENGFTFSFF